MRQKGTNEQLAERRARGLALLAEGKTSKEVAEILEVTKRSVDRWQADAKKPKKKKAGRLPGRPRKLSAKRSDWRKHWIKERMPLGMPETTGPWIELLR